MNNETNLPKYFEDKIVYLGKIQDENFILIHKNNSINDKNLRFCKIFDSYNHTILIDSLSEINFGSNFKDSIIYFTDNTNINELYEGKKVLLFEVYKLSEYCFDRFCDNRLYNINKNYNKFHIIVDISYITEDEIFVLEEFFKAIFVKCKFMGYYKLKLSIDSIQPKLIAIYGNQLTNRFIFRFPNGRIIDFESSNFDETWIDYLRSLAEKRITKKAIIKAINTKTKIIKRKW